MAPKKIKRVLLVFPPTITAMEAAQYVCPPLGLAYIAAYIRDRYEVKILDATVEGYEREEVVDGNRVRFGLSPDDIEKVIRSFQPDVLGVSCLYSNQFEEVLEICRRGKGINGNMVTVTGGAHPTFMADRCLREKALDYIVLGEGEKSFDALLRALEKGEGLKDIGGLAYKEGEEVKVDERISYIEDLDSLPLPARDLLPMEKYFAIDLPMGVTSRAKPSTSLITSRGCPMKCSFCSSHRFWGDRYRTRSPEKVVEEIKGLVRDYGLRELKFHDDNLTLNKKRAKEIFRRMVGEDTDLLWTAPNGLSVWTLDDELLALMRKSGCYEISVAIESGDEQVLKEIVNKPLNLTKTRETVNKIKNHGIDTSAFFMIGFPGETKEQIEKTLDYARLIKVDRVSLMIVNPLPGSQVYDICLKKGYIDGESRLAGNDYCRAHIPIVGLSARNLEKLRNRWFLRNNLLSFFRNPFRFLLRYGKFIFARPSVALDLLHLKKVRLSFKNLFQSVA